MAKIGNSARLIHFARADAASNMAIDEAILEAHLMGIVPSTLRLYQFSPPAVSVGYAQKLSDKTIENITSQGFSLVRRPTGGRAVLHLNDLTYSFVGSCKSADDQAANALLSASVLGAYRQICQGLVLAFQQLGLELEMGRSKAPGRDQIDCFEASTIADLHYQGKKLIGSAQVRRKHALLQHGSIILNQPQELMQQLIRQKRNGQFEAEDKHPAHHANLYEIADRSISIEEIQSALTSGFEKALSVSFTVSTLTDQELTIYKGLRSKYKRLER